MKPTISIPAHLSAATTYGPAANPIPIPISTSTSATNNESAYTSSKDAFPYY